MWVLKTTPWVGNVKQGQNPHKCGVLPGRERGRSCGRRQPCPCHAISRSASTLPGDLEHLFLLPLGGTGSAGCPFPRKALCKGTSIALHGTAAIPGLDRRRDSPGVCPLSATLEEALSQLMALTEGRASSLPRLEVTSLRVRIRNPRCELLLHPERRKHLPNSSSTPRCRRLPPACPI